MNTDVEAWTPPETTPSMRDLEMSQAKLRPEHSTLSNLIPASGSQGSSGTSRLKELQERLRTRTPESTNPEGKHRTWRLHTYEI